MLMSSASHTVVVTGANSPTGRGLLPRLAGQGLRVVALVRTAERLPADEIIDDWTRSPRAVEALADASVVIHLGGVFAAADWPSYEAGNVATTRAVVSAISPAARLIYLSYVGADPTHGNWYIKSKGQAEDLVRTIADSVIFRADAIAGGRDAPRPFELMFLQTASDAPVRIFGDGTQRFRPIHAADVLDAVTSAVTGRGKAGTYDLVGPSEFAVAQLPEMINGRPVPVERVPAPEAMILPGPPRTVVDLLASPPTPSDPDIVAQVFGLSLIPPETTWPLAPIARCVVRAVRGQQAGLGA
jgi:nucleoside-diphosphate-sugar epimerase